MSVLVEDGHTTTYPLNHARILYRNVITAATATGSEVNQPPASALTKTTYERWRPLVSGDSITGTFPEQVINAVALAAHSDLTPTVEIRVGGVWETVQAFPPEGPSLVSDFAAGEYELLEYSPDNEAVLFLIKPRLCDAVRITVTYSGTTPSLGVLMAGTVLEMHRPFYGGHTPAMLTSDSVLQPNISESGEWLGASLLRQGRQVRMSWDNLPAAWVRRHWQPFSDVVLQNPFVVAWNPLRASADAIYCSASERPEPRNTGTRTLQSVSLSARGYSDGTTPVVLPLTPSSFDEQYPSFTRLSEGTYYDFNSVLRTAAINEPRFDHDPVTGEALGLLIEEERENLFSNSEFNSGSGLVTSDTLKLGASDVPAARFGYDGSTTSFAYSNSTVNSGESAVISVFVEMDDGSAPTFEGASASSPQNPFALVLNNAALSPGGNTYRVDRAQGNVYRVSVAVPSASAGASANSGVLKFSSNSDATFRVTGRQVEPGTFLTSYIKTEGSPATREADIVTSGSAAPWFNPSQGTYLVELVPTVVIGAGAQTGKVFTVGDGSTNNRIEISIDTSNARFVLNREGQTPTDAKPFPALSVGQTYRLAVSVNGETGESILSVNGSTVLVSAPDRKYDFTGVGMQLAVGNAQAIGLSERIGGGRYVLTKALPKALTEKQLAALTKLE